MSRSDLDNALDYYGRVSQVVNYPNGTVIGFDEQEKHSFKIEKARLRRRTITSRKFGEIDENLTNLSHLVPYAIGGLLKIHRDFVLSIASGAAASCEKENYQKIGNLNSLCAKTLLSFCDPSPFGDLVNQETKVDPAVRLGMECPAARIKIAAFSGDKQLANADLVENIRIIVQHALLQNQKKGGHDLVLHKLNVYSENGHFQPHTDTPTHDPSIFLGTVVVCLPSPHEGGDLIVRHAGQETVFNFATESINSEVIQYAAFYGDCQHEVQRVTAGHRIVLTYSILKSDSRPGYNHNLVTNGVCTTSGPHQPETQVAELLDTLYTSIQKAPLPERFIGLYLAYDYTESALAAQSLKGDDKLIYDHLTEDKQIPVSLVAVVQRTHYQMYKRSEDVDSSDVGQVQGTPDFSVRLLEGFGDTRLEGHKNIPKNVPFLCGHSPSRIKVRAEDKPQHHAGNWVEAGSTERVYIKCAMIVGPIPEYIASVAVAQSAVDVETTTLSGVKRDQFGEPVVQDGEQAKSEEDEEEEGSGDESVEDEEDEESTGSYYSESEDNKPFGKDQGDY